MVNVFDVEPGKLIEALKEELKKVAGIKAPEWSGFVKTGISREMPPVQDDFWHIRAASIMAVIPPEGMPRASIEMKCPQVAELFADSGPATPSMAP